MEKITIGTTEYTIVEELGEYGYDWTIGAAMRDEAGSWFFVYDSGCSCTEFGDHLSEGDLVACRSPHEVIEAAKAADVFGDEEVVGFADRLLFRQ